MVGWVNELTLCASAQLNNPLDLDAALIDQAQVVPFKVYPHDKPSAPSSAFQGPFTHRLEDKTKTRLPLTGRRVHARSPHEPQV